MTLLWGLLSKARSVPRRQSIGNMWKNDSIHEIPINKRADWMLHRKRCLLLLNRQEFLKEFIHKRNEPSNMVDISNIKELFQN